MQIKPVSVFCCFILLVFFLTSSCLFADVDTLERIAEAETEVPYVGLRLKTLSTSRGSRTMEEIVIHRTAEESYRKVVSIVGAPKAITEGNGEENKKEEDDRDTRSRRGREFRWERHRSQFSVKAIELIAQNYELDLRHWGEKIAGHETDLMIIKPKHPGRPTKHLFFARKNGVILRVEDLDAAGILRDMFVYTRISFEQKTVKNKWESLRKEIKPEPRRERPAITLAEGEKFLKTKPIEPKFLPQGFQLQGLYKRQFRGDYLQLKYTDGILDINLFERTSAVESESTNRPSNRGDRDREVPVVKIGDISVRKYQRGPDNAFSWRSKRIHFFITGPIPPAELKKVVESIILKNDKK